VSTCARTSETISVEWSELDVDAKMWVVPARQMKAGESMSCFSRIACSTSFWPVVNATRSSREVNAAHAFDHASHLVPPREPYREPVRTPDHQAVG